MLEFIKEFIKNPRFIGAVAPSSRHLAEKMLEDIDFKNSTCIIEYGPGTGVFTERLVDRKRDNTLLIVLRIIKSFIKNSLKCMDIKIMSR